MSEIIREVDEELQRERYERLWKKYGSYIIALVLVVVLGVAGYVGWREYQKRQALADSAAFSAALELAREGKEAEAAEAFGRMAESGTGYRSLALLQAAAARLRAKDIPGAVTVYDRLATDSGSDPLFRDLGRYLAALALADTAPAAELEQRLQPLTAPDNTWRFQARELLAAAKLRSGDREAARRAFQELADDATAPAGIRARAAELVAALQIQS